MGDTSNRSHKFAGASLLVWLIGILMVTLIANYFRIGFDSTDDHKTGRRSGMGHHIDHETGCEYLSMLLGGLTPRLDAEGRHICRKPENG